jgi:hypothetical protein
MSLLAKFIRHVLPVKHAIKKQRELETDRMHFASALNEVASSNALDSIGIRRNSNDFLRNTLTETINRLSAGGK